jgi:hypothetical protein
MHPIFEGTYRHTQKSWRVLAQAAAKGFLMAAFGTPLPAIHLK